MNAVTAHVAPKILSGFIQLLVYWSKLLGQSKVTDDGQFLRACGDQTPCWLHGMMYGVKFKGVNLTLAGRPDLI